MGRHRRALSLAAAVAACGHPAEPKPAPSTVVVDAGSPAVVAVVDAGPPPPPPAPKVDCSLQADQISDDETPTFKGVTHSERALDWLAAHGITNADAIKWYVARVGHGLDAERAEIALGEAPCFSFTIEKEEAIVCEMPGFDSLMQVNALGLTVRKKKPAVVFETGIELRAMDFPDSRFLDLQILFAPDFKSFELRDRAPNGTTLVMAPSACEAQQKALRECAERLASGQGDVSLCPITTDPSGKKTLITKLPKNPSYPAAIHDCAGASEKVVGLLTVAGPDADPKMKAEGQRAISFITKTCRARGQWTWTGGRYLRLELPR